MIHYARIISCYTADTSGVCSALYELGGMVVVHDASGCNSTYATHDEPRWYTMDSMIYISGLTEIDAVMGNDEKFIADVCESAGRLHPKFIAICGSPMPAMTGTDFDALADIIQQRSGIKTFAMHTNGMKSYLVGASQAFEMLARNYCERSGRAKNKPVVNLLGATPLDLSRQEIIDHIWEHLSENDFEKGCCMAMGGTLEDYAAAGDADCNLVVSSSGLEAARVLKQKFGTPFVTGLPFGKEYSSVLSKDIMRAVQSGEDILSCAEREDSGERDIAVVGESVYAGSVARAVSMQTGRAAKVIHTLDTDSSLVSQYDKTLADEDKLEAEFANYKLIIADPLFKPIVNESTGFVPIAHEAFSGRCFRKSIPDLVNNKIDLEI